MSGLKANLISKVGMHNICLSFNYHQPIYIENMLDYFICRTNNQSVHPCKKFPRTLLGQRP